MAKQTPKTDEDNSEKETIPFVARYVLSGLIFALILVDLRWESVQLSWIHIAMIVLAILPWLHSFMDSFDISPTGFKAKFRELKRDVDAIVDATSEPDADDKTNETEAAAKTSSSVSITSQQRDILNALVNSRFALRSRSGIRRDAKISKDVNLTTKMNELKDEGLVRQRRGKEGNPLWSITSEGISALEGYES